MDDFKSYIQNLRRDFALKELDEKSVDADPLDQFTKWLKEAVNAQVPEPNAMILSTTGKDLKPSARVVLLRDFNEKGFGFYTNYHSKKGQQISQNPFGSLTFFWHQLERQVRIEGTIEKMSEAVSDDYFNNRPLESRVGAWASSQSEVVTSRDELEKKYTEIVNQYGKNVPRPENWGGYYLKPNEIEFWQGRPNRLHDRIVYRSEANSWKKFRLFP